MKNQLFWTTGKPFFLQIRQAQIISARPATAAKGSSVLPKPFASGIQNLTIAANPAIPHSTGNGFIKSTITNPANCKILQKKLSTINLLFMAPPSY